MPILRRNALKLFGYSLASASFASAFSATASGVAKDTWQSLILSKLNQLKDKPQTLRFLVPNGSQANFSPLSRVLAQHANIQVKLDVAPVDDINTQLLLAHGSEQHAYDLAIPATYGLPDLARSGAIQALDTFATKHEPQGFKDDMLYTHGDFFEGKFLGYQTDGDAYLMFYNRSLLEDSESKARYEDMFGAPLDVPKSWRELDQQMQFFHAPNEGRFGGSLFRTADYAIWEWWARFHAKGYFPLKDDLSPQIDNDAGIAALEELMAASAYLSPNSSSNGLFENWYEYAAGKTYCNIGWGGTQKFLNSDSSKVKGKLRFSPLPGGEIRGQSFQIPYFNWGWNYTVPSGAEHAETAYLCSLLAVSPDISTLAVREDGYFDPFRDCHYDDAVIQEMYSPSFLKAHRESMYRSIPDFYLIGQSKYMDTLKTYFQSALLGEISPKAALQAASTAWQGLHYRFGVDAQTKTWAAIKQRYPQHLKQLLQ